MELNQKRPDTWHPTLYAICGKRACDQTEISHAIDPAGSVEALRQGLKVSLV